MKYLLVLFMMMSSVAGSHSSAVAQTSESPQPSATQLLKSWSGTWGSTSVTLDVTEVKDNRAVGIIDLRSAKFGASGPQPVVGKVTYKDGLIVLSLTKTGKIKQHFELILVEPNKLEGQGSSDRTAGMPVTLTKN